MDVPRLFSARAGNTRYTMDYAFHIYNRQAADGAAIATEKLLRADWEKKQISTRRFRETAGAGMRSTENSGENIAPPVIVCIGSDLAIGDSLGPITGSLLKYKTQGLGVFVYGTLAAPITAKEVKFLRPFLKETHAGSQIIAVDAAVGAEGDIGLIRLMDTPLYPGAGANKRLGAIGDISVLGIVAEKSVANYGLLNTTRLNLVYSMAQIVSDALSAVLWERQKHNPFSSNA